MKTVEALARLQDEILTGPYAHRTYAEKFWSMVDKHTLPAGCWLFTGKLYKNGYGCFRACSEGLLAHRVAYALIYGAFDDKLLVCHTCDNRQCVNPKHLFLGTPHDNMQDMLQKKRGNPPRGSKGRTLLTEDDVTRIFEMHETGMLHRQIAERFNVKGPTVSRILNGKRWEYRTRQGSGDQR